MATSSIDYFYNVLGLNDLKIHYDFSSSSISGSYVTSALPTIGSTNSGFLVNVPVVNLSGSFPSSSSSKITIQNIDSSFDTLGTHIFNFERTGVLGSGLLFSSLMTGTLNSGYNIGLTDSNLMYFEYIGPSGYEVVNSNALLANKNAVAVLIGNNSVSFNHYDFNYKTFEIETKTIKSNELLFSNKWELRGASGTALGNYLYFNKNIPTNNLTRLFSGFYSFPTGFPAVSGSEVYLEQLGYSVPTGNYGDTTYSVSFSGFNSEFFDLLNGQFGDPIIWGEISNAFLISSGSMSGVDVIPSGSYAVLMTGSTGNFSGDYHPFYYGSISTPYMYSGGNSFPYNEPLTGTFVMFDTSISSCPTNPVFNIQVGNNPDAMAFAPIIVEKTRYYEIDPAYSGVVINSGVTESYGMSRISYLWDKKTGDSTEIIVFTGGLQTSYLGKKSVYDLVEGEFSSEGYFPSGNVNLFVNGLFQVESGYTLGGNVFYPTYTPLADFYTDSQFFNSNGFNIFSDEVAYDNDQQQNRRIFSNIYTGTNLTSGNTYNFNNKLVFLNGQKLISGVDYIYSGANFSGSPEIRAVGGSLCIVNSYTGQYLVTGQYNYTGLNFPKFPRDSSLFYLNGIRISDSLKVEHSNYSLMTGNYTYSDLSSTTNELLNSSNIIF